MKFYVDGILKESKTYTGKIPSSASVINFGKMPLSGFEYYLNGYLDDIGIWNRVLTDQEINNLFNACTGPVYSEFSAAGCLYYLMPWGETTYASGDFVHTYTTAKGCDSITTAHVTIRQTEITASVDISGLDSLILPWGQSVTTSGYYYHTYQNRFGCDSSVTFYVVIEKASDENSRNIGINKSNPQRNLHVNDVIRLQPRSTSPENPVKGDMYFDSVLNKLRVFDGTQWQNTW
jgi:hypothetical protein